MEPARVLEVGTVRYVRLVRSIWEYRRVQAHEVRGSEFGSDFGRAVFVDRVPHERASAVSPTDEAAATSALLVTPPTATTANERVPAAIRLPLETR